MGLHLQKSGRGFKINVAGSEKIQIQVDGLHDVWGAS
jgi:hypothetical protein